MEFHPRILLQNYKYIRLIGYQSKKIITSQFVIFLKKLESKTIFFPETYLKYQQLKKTRRLPLRQSCKNIIKLNVQNLVFKLQNNTQLINKTMSR